jgi:hypothetical protein
MTWRENPRNRRLCAMPVRSPAAHIHPLRIPPSREKAKYRAERAAKEKTANGTSFGSKGAFPEKRGINQRRKGPARDDQGRRRTA